MGTIGDKKKARNRLIDHILAMRGPPLPKPDHAGMFRRITGTFRDEGSVGGDPCVSDEGWPHVCDDCEADPRSLSVDWIG